MRDRVLAYFGAVIPSGTVGGALATNVGAAMNSSGRVRDHPQHNRGRGVADLLTVVPLLPNQACTHSRARAAARGNFGQDRVRSSSLDQLD